MTGGVSKLWPDVTSPVARRVLVYLFNLPGTYTDSDFTSRMLQLERERQQLFGSARLWQMIQESDVSLFLAGGPELTPEITAGMPQLDRLIYRLVKPRTLEQRVAEIARNLEWYINPVVNQPASLSRSLRPLVYAIPMVFVSLAILVGASLLAGSSHAMFVPLILLALAAGLLLTSVVLSLSARQQSQPAEELYRIPISKLPISYEARATVLYHYLRREFSDLREDG